MNNIKVECWDDRRTEIGDWSCLIYIDSDYNQLLFVQFLGDTFIGEFVLTYSRSIYRDYAHRYFLSIKEEQDAMLFKLIYGNGNE